MFISIPFCLSSYVFLQYNVVKKWLEVEIAPDIRGRIPLLLTSLSFKVSELEIPGEEIQAPKLAVSGVCIGYKKPCMYLSRDWFGTYLV